MPEGPAPWRAVVARLLADDAAGLRRGLAVAAVLVAVAIATTVGILTSRQATTPVELTLPRAAPAEPATSDGPGDGGADATAPVVAHAAGAVVNPGLYRLPAGARVADLLAAAGGPARDADVDALNLAAKLGDGERIYVPRKGEVVPVAGGGVAGGAGGGGTANGANALIDLNTATLEQLDSLPGVGPATAQAIIDFRRERGRFRSVDQLLEVRGIGEAKLRQIRPRVRV